MTTFQRKTALLLALLAAALPAQVITEQTIVTDSIDVFTTGFKSGKSPGIAMVQTLVLPGWGHHYLEKRNRALVYFTADALCLFGAVFSERFSRGLYESARSYARTYADAAGAEGLDEYYWQNLAVYEDSRTYNYIQELNRTPERKYVDPDLQWNWADVTFMDTYKEIWEHATTFHVASTFFIGAMVLNRVIAFIDIRTTTRYRGIKKTSSMHILPFLASGYKTGMILTTSF